MKLFKRQLQLAASVPVHSLMFRIHFLDPEFLSDREIHGVRVPNLLQDGHRHVRYSVARTIKMCPDSFLQVGPRLPVSPRHADPMLVHPGPELRHRFPAILLTTSRLFAGYAVDDPGCPAVDGRVDDGHGAGLRGPDLLALLDKVTGGAISTLSHSLTLTFWASIWVRGRGHPGSDEFLPEARGPPVGDHRRLFKNFLEPGVALHIV